MGHRLHPRIHEVTVAIRHEVCTCARMCCTCRTRSSLLVSGLWYRTAPSQLLSVWDKTLSAGKPLEDANRFRLKVLTRLRVMAASQDTDHLHLLGDGTHFPLFVEVLLQKSLAGCPPSIHMQEVPLHCRQEPPQRPCPASCRLCLAHPWQPWRLRCSLAVP